MKVNLILVRTSAVPFRRQPPQSTYLFITIKVLFYFAALKNFLDTLELHDRYKHPSSEGLQTPKSLHLANFLVTIKNNSETSGDFPSSYVLFRIFTKTPTSMKKH